MGSSTCHSLCWVVVMGMIFLVDQCTCVRFSTKQVYGSSCLHDLDSGNAIVFDRGEMLEFVKSSRAVYITPRGVHFITASQTVRFDQVRFHVNHTAAITPSAPASDSATVRCVIPSSDSKGSLCVVPSFQEISTSQSALNSSSSSFTSISTWSEVLPCSPEFTPRMTMDKNILPPEYGKFLDAEGETSSCRNVGRAAGLRYVLVGQQSSAYDITQCDFSASGITILYSSSTGIMYMTRGSNLSDGVYVLLGITVVVLVSCITQHIVHMVNSKRARQPMGVVCLLCVCIVLPCILATTETGSGTGGGGTLAFVTNEEVVSFFYMIIYCFIRLGVVLLKVLTVYFSAPATSTPDSGWFSIARFFKRVVEILREQGDTVASDHYYNLMVIMLQLVAARVYLSMCTPYTLGIAFLLGSRLFLKAYESTALTSKGSVKNNSSVYQRWYDNLIMVADSILLQFVYVSGIMPDFSTPSNAYIVTVVLLFASISAARVVHGFSDLSS